MVPGVVTSSKERTTIERKPGFVRMVNLLEEIKLVQKTSLAAPGGETGLQRHELRYESKPLASISRG
jgi:hypothetical protein